MQMRRRVNILQINISENNYPGSNLITLPLFPPAQLLRQQALANSSVTESPFYTFVIPLNLMGGNVAF